MRLVVHAVGRLKSGPERELVTRYLDRFSRTAPALGLSFGDVHEIPESRSGNARDRRRDEAAKLEALLTSGARLIVLDETGKTVDSQKFAELIATERDAGTRQLVFAIGGPDGHDAALLEKATAVISFGRMTWPHQLARIMLAEQLYRAATILTGHPYHRG